MENPNSTSQDVPKFLSICPISMAQFQEKFIFLGKKKKNLCPCVSQNSLFWKVIKDEGEA